MHNILTLWSLCFRTQCQRPSAVATCCYSEESVFLPPEPSTKSSSISLFIHSTLGQSQEPPLFASPGWRVESAFEASPCTWIGDEESNHVSQANEAVAFPPIGSHYHNISMLAVVSLFYVGKLLHPGECFNGDDDTGPTLGPISVRQPPSNQ